ncbi:hypothetical protein BDV10DRAFT_168803 [Aspergillus recurvatus]
MRDAVGYGVYVWKISGSVFICIVVVSSFVPTGSVSRRSRTMRLCLMVTCFNRNPASRESAVFDV